MKKKQISPDSNNTLNHPLKPLRKAKTCSRQMDAIIQGSLLSRTVPVMADAVAASSRIRQEPITLSPARSSLRKAGAPNQTVHWQGQKQDGVCCAEEMAEEIITTKETLPPIHSPTSCSPSSLPINNHTPGYSLFFLPLSISASRILEHAWRSRKTIGDALRTVMLERPTRHSVGASLASRHHTQKEC